MFYFWTADKDSDVPYDFSQPVNGAIDLYAKWGTPIVVTAYAVDASTETPVVVNPASATGWTVNNITVAMEAVQLNGSNITAPSGYTFAFAAAGATESLVCPAILFLWPKSPQKIFPSPLQKKRNVP